MASFLSSFFHPGRAYREAGDVARDYYSQAQGFQQPYLAQGQEAYGQLGPAMQRLLNPQQLQGEWISGYEMSPYAQQQAEMARQQGVDAASALGLTGSSPALRAMQAGTSNIVAQDRQRYLDDLMQKYMGGVGLAQNIYGTGAQTASQAANQALNMGQRMSELMYGQQAAPGQMFGQLLGTGAGLAGSLLGGPIGGALANKFVGQWGPYAGGKA